MRQKLLLVTAVFFGILAFVLTYQQIQAEKQRIRGEAEVVYVIRLAKDIAPNEELKEIDLLKAKTERFRGAAASAREIPWESSLKIIGRKLRASMDKGQVLQWDDLKPASRKFSGLTGIVPPGYRAISIPVDTTSSVTNLINPDDHIDIIGTFRFPEMKSDQALDTITMTILQNVRVLATGANWGTVSGAQLPQTAVRGYSTITLALTPKEVEMIIFASQKGRLSLSLRNDEETKFESNLQSVNFKFLEQNIPNYNSERQNRQNMR
jgi:pilus assembly protein CpaB